MSPDFMSYRQHEALLAAAQCAMVDALGAEARRLTLKKAHASLRLQWRGHGMPSREEVQRSAGPQGASRGRYASVSWPNPVASAPLVTP